jgi:hypothetical protein
LLNRSCRARMKISVVPAGLVPNFLGLPRTCVWGCYAAPSGLGFGGAFCVFVPTAGYGAAEAALFQNGGFSAALHAPLFHITACGMRWSPCCARQRGWMEGTDLGSCIKASVVPAGLGSYSVGLPQTCVRGCTMPPLRGWGFGGAFCVFVPMAGYGAAEDARFQNREALSQRWKRCATQSPMVEVFVGQECPTHTGCLSSCGGTSEYRARASVVPAGLGS